MLLGVALKTSSITKIGALDSALDPEIPVATDLFKNLRIQLKIPACTIDDLDLIRKSRRRHRIGRQCRQHRQYCRLFDVQAKQIIQIYRWSV